MSDINTKHGKHLTVVRIHDTTYNGLIKEALQQFML